MFFVLSIICNFGAMEHEEEEIQKHIDKIKSVTSGENIIAGIHNYCDRWCERCTHTKHCSVFQMDPRTVDEVSDMDNKEFWENLSLNMAATFEMIQQQMEDLGIDLDDIPEYIEPEHIETEAEKVTKEYSYKVMDWVEKSTDIFKETMLLEGAQNEAMILAIDDAIEVIKWYAMFIHVKTHRAMKLDDDLWGEDEDFEFRYHDNLGSAKITLISIDRSMEAFSFLLKYMDKNESDILHFLAQLSKSKRLIIERWPTAKDFKRPGFD